MRIQAAKQEEKKKHGSPKNMIVSLLDMENNTATVVGVMGNDKNNFGAKFLDASEKLHIDVKQDSFSANILTVHKDNLIKLINELPNNM